MPAFLVRVRAHGALKTIEIHADGAETARRQARRFGHVMGVSQKRRALGRGMNATERYTFLVRLSTMLRSRVGGAEALRLLRDSFTGRISGCAGHLLELMESGTDLATAIGEDKRNFPGAVGMIVKLGAATGQMHRTLREAADFEMKIHQIRRLSGRGLVSGLAGFAVAAVILVLSNFYIWPMVLDQTIIRQNIDRLGLEWVPVLAVAGLATVALVLGLLLALYWLATVARLVMPVAADAIILRLPWYREIVLAQDTHVTLRRLSLLIRAGVRVEEALTATLEAARPGQLREDLRNALLALRSGQKWAHGLQSLHPTDRAALALAADRAEIAENLDAIAEQAQSLYAQRLATFGPLMQLAAALAVSLAGFVLFAQSVLPMLVTSRLLLD